MLSHTTQTPWDITRYQEILWNTIRYQQIPTDTNRYHESLWDTIRYHTHQWMLQITNRYHETPQHTIKLYGISANKIPPPSFHSRPHWCLNKEFISKMSLQFLLCGSLSWLPFQTSSSQEFCKIIHHLYHSSQHCPYCRAGQSAGHGEWDSGHSVPVH